MSDPYVREVGRITDSYDGLELTVGVDYDSVTIGSGLTKWRLSAAAAEEFAQAFVSACWQAGENRRRMAEQTEDVAAEIADDADRCPRCGSPDPAKHPAVQFEGEVQICPDPWHQPAP